MNLSLFLEDSARKYADHPAFTFMDNTLSFKSINAAANQVANALTKHGIKQGDKIGLSCLNLPYFPILYFGILKAGAVVVPLSVLLKPDEIKFHLTDCDAVAYFCFEGTPQLPMAQMGIKGFSEVEACTTFIEIKANPADTSTFEGATTFSSFVKDMPYTYEPCATGTDDTAVIIYTSGTTGKPKGAQLTHNNLISNAIVSQDFTSLSSADTQLIVLPLFHIFAMTVLMNAGVYKGTHSILLPRFETKTVFDLFAKHKITFFAGVPTMYWGMINGLDDSVNVKELAKNLRLAVSGGASLPLSVLNDFKEKFDVEILEGYGMSEGSPVVTFNQLDVGTKPGSVGTPAWGVRVKLVDADGNEVPVGEKGELLYKGPNVMKGYYKRPEANAKSLIDGWLYSGDIAIKDKDGFYYIVDRTKDMIIRGGLNVYPREVEEAMMQNDVVSMVAVIGIPDEQRGEEIKAFVILKEGAAITEDELKLWTKSKIADYKYPRIVEFVASLPMSATGKILKKELRKD